MNLCTGCQARGPDIKDAVLIHFRNIHTRRSYHVLHLAFGAGRRSFVACALDVPVHLRVTILVILLLHPLRSVVSLFNT